jgi:indole-3-glycerol phosphate synthase
VLARDWIIHPLQLAEAKEAGAAGVLGVIGQVNGRGTAVMSSFGAALGLDCPVEVVNARVSRQTDCLDGWVASVIENRGKEGGGVG